MMVGGKTQEEWARDCLTVLERLLPEHAWYQAELKEGPLVGLEAYKSLDALFQIGAACFLLQRAMVLAGFTFTMEERESKEFWAEFEQAKEPQAGGQGFDDLAEVAIYLAAKRALDDLEGMR